MSEFTLSLTPDGEGKYRERKMVERVLLRIANDIGSTAASTGSVIENGQSVASWTLTTTETKEFDR